MYFEHVETHTLEAFKFPLRSAIGWVPGHDVKHLRFPLSLKKKVLLLHDEEQTLGVTEESTIGKLTSHADTHFFTPEIIYILAFTPVQVLVHELLI